MIKVLEKLNRADYVLYDYFNKTLWSTVDALGKDNVESVAAEIDKRSKEVEAECILTEKKQIGNHIKAQLKPEKEKDPDCLGFIAHGPAMTKLIQRRMIDLMGKTYKQCPKRTTGSTTWWDNMERRKSQLQNEYNTLASSTSYTNQLR